MISPQAIEEAALCLLCFSNQHAPLLALKLTDTKLFSNQTNRELGRAAGEYVLKYGTAPAMQLEYLLENEIKRGDEGKLLWQQIEFLEKQIKQIDPVFVLEQLDKYLDIQKLNFSLQKAIEHLGQGELDLAREEVHKQSVSNQLQSSGIWLSDPKKFLSFLDKEALTDYFSLGIDLMDIRGIRPERKTLSILLAAAKKGKTWFLTGIGKAGVQYQHKVLHVTLELSEEKTARRYVQSLFSLTKDEAQNLKVPFFQKDPDTNATTIQFNDLTRDSIIAKRKDIEKRLAGMKSSHLLIKEFPTGTLSLEHLDMYIESLKREKDFIPDLIIIDYADLMRLDSKNLRIDTGVLYKGIRGIGVSRNAAMVSATQGNRESDDAKLVDVGNVAEDWSKIGTADNILTYSQTAAEKQLGLARVFAAACRDAEDRFIALISQAYPIGQFCIDSTGMSTELINQIQGSPPS